jgi:subtilisin family serine protease
MEASRLRLISLIFLVLLAPAVVFAQAPGHVYPLVEGKQLGLALTGNPGTPHRALIGFKEMPGRAEEALVRGAGGSIRYTYHLVPAIAATIPEAAVEGLLRNPRVSSIDADGVVHAIDAELDNAWGVKRIGAGLVHDGGNKGAGVRVAVLDTGIAYDHPDLDANYHGGYDFVNGDGDPYDDHYHGTHVAGSLAAEDDGAWVVGVAPEAWLYALKVLDSSGNGYFSDIIAALEWAVDNNIQVTNNSYGSRSNPGGVVQAAFDNAYAAGIVHVAAAGNEGNCGGKQNSVDWPASYSSVISVAATDWDDQRPCFSSTGPDVELAAPGVSILSTVPGGYAYASGTSMASPHAAGAAALVIAEGIADANGNGRVNDEVRQIMDDTALDLGTPGHDAWYGYGLVLADAAVASVGTPPNSAPAVSITSPADGSTFGSGASILFQGTAGDAEDGDLTAGLVWTSDIDGQIGTGGSFSAVLNDGDHTITASVADSDGVAGSDSIAITVGSPAPEPGADTATVDSIAYGGEGGRSRDKHLLVTVHVSDDLGSSVSGALVSIRLDREGSPLATSTGTTDPSGNVTFKQKNAPSGCYQTVVTGVTAAGLAWDGVTPPNSYCK